MDTNLLTLLIMTAQCAVSLAGYGFAAFLTKPQNIIMNVKPFTCKSCLSFWLAFIPGAILAAFSPAVLPLCAFSAALGLINYFRHQSKIVE